MKTQSSSPRLGRPLRWALVLPELGRLGVLDRALDALSGVVSARLRGAADWLDQGQHRQSAVDLPGATRFASRPMGQIALVGAGPGSRDLLTLRAVQRLQSADVVFYDRLVDPEVLDLLPAHVERVFVGKHVGAHTWPQERICDAIVAAARKGKRVVRLKSGDPGIFGRATEELAAADAAGISCELVPGVTAASAAAAMLRRSLTERNVSDALILATAAGCADDPTPNAARFAGPGTTTAFYMAVRAAERVSNSLMHAGLPGTARVDIAVDVSKPEQRHLKASVETLAAVLRQENILGGAILLVTWPKAEPMHLGYSEETHPDHRPHLVTSR